MQHIVNKINAEFGEGTADVSFADQYYNMREKIEPVSFIVAMAEAAMKDKGGELGDFDAALAASYQSMANDTTMIRKKRAEKKTHAAGQHGQ